MDKSEVRTKRGIMGVLHGHIRCEEGEGSVGTLLGYLPRNRGLAVNNGA